MGNVTSLRSAFQQYMPSGQDNYIAEAAYDIWLNNWRTEVMIWVDNHRQVPLGQLDGTYDICGEKFQLWQDGPGINAYDAFVLQGKQQNSGYAHILSALRILVARGDIPSDSTVTDLEFGWEICSTDNHPLSLGRSPLRGEALGAERSRLITVLAARVNRDFNPAAVLGICYAFIGFGCARTGGGDGACRLRMGRSGRRRRGSPD
jgi:Glycosyl hydrolase family 12